MAGNLDEQWFTGSAFGGAFAMAAEATDQGQSGTCVPHALAAAIKDQVEDRVEKNFSFDASFAAEAKSAPNLKQGTIVSALMQEEAHANGSWPTVWNGFRGNIEDTKGRWYEVQVVVNVVENTTLNQEALEAAHQPQPHKGVHVISYDADNVHAGIQGRHCVYLQGVDAPAFTWIGMNSWGDTDAEPRIPMRTHHVQIYDVQVTRITKLCGCDGLKGDLLLHPTSLSQGWYPGMFGISYKPVDPGYHVVGMGGGLGVGVLGRGGMFGFGI